jgi:hypothetical protein
MHSVNNTINLKILVIRWCSDFFKTATLLQLPPLKFHCVGGCWDWTLNCCTVCIGSRTLYDHSARSHPVNSYMSVDTVRHHFPLGTGSAGSILLHISMNVQLSVLRISVNYSIFLWSVHYHVINGFCCNLTMDPDTYTSQNGFWTYELFLL